MLQQSSEKSLKVGGAQVATVTLHDESTRIYEGGRRESSITERKVYASPITRYELNRKVEEVSSMMEGSKQRLSLSTHNQPKLIYY